MRRCVLHLHPASLHCPPPSCLLYWHPAADGVTPARTECRRYCSNQFNVGDWCDCSQAGFRQLLVATPTT
jgi:hypothetical protein